jgi:hypothetical protein
MRCSDLRESTEPNFKVGATMGVFKVEATEIRMSAIETCSFFLGPVRKVRQSKVNYLGSRKTNAKKATGRSMQVAGRPK